MDQKITLQKNNGKMESSSGGLFSTDSILSACSICQSKTADLMLLEEYEQLDMEQKLPLRDMMLALSANKVLPSGRVCKNCVQRAKDAWKFQQQLQTANQEPSLSDKIRILRHQLKKLTQKIDVFIVVGPEKNDANTEYPEDNVIMVDKNLPDDPFLDELEAENALECSICPENFYNDSELVEHLKTHPIDATHTCRVCERNFPSRNQVMSHKLRHKLKDTRQCLKCSKVFKTANELSQHQCKITCPSCPRVFEDRLELSKHIRVNHDINSHDSSYACPICFEGFTTGVELEIHSATHPQTSHYICGHDGCVSRFSTRADVLNHVNETHFKMQEISEPYHEVKLEFQCGICQRTFKSEKSLKRHESRLHNASKGGSAKPRVKTPSLRVSQKKNSVPEPLEVVNMEPEGNNMLEPNVESLEERTDSQQSLEDDDFQMVYVGVDEDLPEGIEYINSQIMSDMNE